MGLPARTTDFIFEMPLTLSELEVTLDDIADIGGATLFTSTIVVEKSGTALTAGVDYTIAGTGPSYTITFATPVTFDETPIRVYRSTTRSSSLVVFPGSAASLDSMRHLNKSAYQWLFLIQELYDRILGCLRATAGSRGTAWDFLGYRGINAEDPEEDQDVTTKKYVDTQDQLILAQAKAYTDQKIAEFKDYIEAWVAAYVANALSVYDTTIKAWVTNAINALRNELLQLIHGGYAGTTTLQEDSVALAAGETVATFAITLNDGPNLVFADGVAQMLATDYSVTAANELTFVFPFATGVTVHVVHFKINT